MKPNIGQGDSGETWLLGGRRVRKDDCQVDAYGDVDELNSNIGLIRSLNNYPEIDSLLERIQQDLFVLGSQLSSAIDSSNMPKLTQENVKFMEENIEKFEKNLPELKHFILPGVGQVAALFHVARTICRRAERRIVELMEKKQFDELCIAYTNRLSDLLFTLSRYVNMKEDKKEKEWIGTK